MDYKTFLETYKTLPSPSVVVFKGSTDPETNENWCSDCVKADPYLKQIIEPECKSRNIPYTEVKVGLRPEWKDPNHPLRTHSDLKIKSVPTLALILGNKIAIALEEDQLWDESILKSFLEELN